MTFFNSDIITVNSNYMIALTANHMTDWLKHKIAVNNNHSISIKSSKNC